MDKIDKASRSKNMSRIKAVNTFPELLLRKSLYKLGYRYRIHYPLKGKPDIVFPKRKMVIFINGCFWHGHGCKLDHTSKTNKKFWKTKIFNNKRRDMLVTSFLMTNGWSVLTVWECEIQSSLKKTIEKILHSFTQ